MSDLSDLVHFIQDKLEISIYNVLVIAHGQGQMYQANYEFTCRIENSERFIYRFRKAQCHCALKSACVLIMSNVVVDMNI